MQKRLKQSSVLQNSPAYTEPEIRQVEISRLFRVGASFTADSYWITSDQNYLRLFPKKRTSGDVSVRSTYAQTW